MNLPWNDNSVDEVWSWHVLEHLCERVEREVQRHRRFVPIILREFLSWEDMARIEVNAPDLAGLVAKTGTSFKTGKDLRDRLNKEAARAAGLLPSEGATDKK